MTGDSSSRPRVAYVAGTYPALSETFVTGELAELARRGVETIVFAVVRGHGRLQGAPPARYVVELSKPSQVACLLALAGRHPVRTARALLDPKRRSGGSARDMAALAPMARAIRGFDHLHAHFAGQPTDVAARLSELTGVPFSFTAHAHDVFVEWERMPSKLRAARFAVTVCEYNRAYITERVPDARLDLVICGVDTGAFARGRPYDPDGPVVAVGRLVEQKGFEYLVRAAASSRGKIPEVLIVGDGPLRGPLQALVEDLRAPVRLLGAQSHEQVRALYESASMAVLPCVVAADGSRDSMPVSLKEAMALELPVVGTDEVGLPELIGPDRGRLVAPRDAAALAAALVAVAELPASERVALGRAGRAFVQEHCNLGTETGKLVDLFATAG
jgi:colanic acid/amylovoran biosynthesis glycosyltransferase